MLYADDLCILSLSSAGLHRSVIKIVLVTLLHLMSKNLYACFSKVALTKHCDHANVYLSGNHINFVTEVTHLGVLLNSSIKTFIDVSRQKLKFYAQANMLLSNFRYCGWEVKCKLFKSISANIYCFPFWFNSTSSIIKKLKNSYNSVARLLCTRMPYSDSEMFVSWGIPSFMSYLANVSFISLSEQVKI